MGSCSDKGDNLNSKVQRIDIESFSGSKSLRRGSNQFFCLETPDYMHCGKQLAKLNLPKFLVLKGGYTIEMVGKNVANVLLGFEGF